jgi:hypothetical protein
VNECCFSCLSVLVDYGELLLISSSEVFDVGAALLELSVGVVRWISMSSKGWGSGKTEKTENLISYSYTLLMENNESRVVGGDLGEEGDGSGEISKFVRMDERK